ncbi:hypothetical protein Ctob_015055, partial [Chrysochromulina tobinii]
MAGGRVLVGVVRSFALWKLDEEVLRGTMELLKLGSSAARRHFAKPCYEEMVLIDSLGCDRKLAATAGVSFRELLALHNRHFGTYSNGRWEAKASVVWAVAEALIGSSDRGIGHLDIDLVRALCVGDEGGLVSIIGLGDPLGETRDRAGTALAALSHLGKQLIELLLGGLDGRSLHEWMESLVETLHETLRGVAESLKGALVRQMERLADAVGTHVAAVKDDALEACRALHATLAQIGAATERAATAASKAVTMLEIVEIAMKKVEEAGAASASLSLCASHARDLKKVAHEVSDAARQAADILSRELIEMLAPAAHDAGGGQTRGKATSSVLGALGMASMRKLGMSMPKITSDKPKAKVGIKTAVTGENDGRDDVPDDAALGARRTAALARLKKLGDQLRGTLSDGAEAAKTSVSSDSLMGPLQLLVAGGQQLNLVLAKTVDDLTASPPPLPKLLESVEFARIREELLGELREHLEELRGAAMRELQGILESATGVLSESESALSESLGVEVDTDALSADCLALDHPICGMLKDAASGLFAKSKVELWHVREVAALAALRVVEAIDRTITEGVYNEQLTTDGKAHLDATDGAAAWLKQREQYLADLERVEGEVKALQAERTRGGEHELKACTKEEELGELSLGGGRYVSPTLLSRAERQAALLEVKESLLRAVMRRRCIERSKSVRSMLRGGEACAAELNVIALSSDAAMPYELLPPHEQLGVQMEALQKGLDSMCDQLLAGVREALYDSDRMPMEQRLGAVLKNQQGLFIMKLTKELEERLKWTAAHADQLKDGAIAAMDTRRRAEEEAQAWGTVHDELVVDIAEALDVLSTEISKVEIEEDPLVRMQGLIRCRDKKEVLGVVVAQTEAEAAAHLDGGEREAAMQMKPVVCQLASVSIRADALIQDELRVLRGALESMEALLHENLAKLNDLMSQPAPDLSLDGLARLIKEQMSELRIDAAEVHSLASGKVTQQPI